MICSRVLLLIQMLPDLITNNWQVQNSTLYILLLTGSSSFSIPASVITATTPVPSWANKIIISFRWRLAVRQAQPFAHRSLLSAQHYGISIWKMNLSITVTMAPRITKALHAAQAWTPAFATTSATVFMPTWI